jgi:ribA/ribD-fused uncharacterized protein
MLSLAVESPSFGAPLTPTELQQFADSLQPFDAVSVLFREPLSANPAHIRSWRGVVVPLNSSSSCEPSTKWIAFDEARLGSLVPLPLSRDKASLVEFLAVRRVPHSHPECPETAPIHSTPLRGSKAAEQLKKDVLDTSGTEGGGRRGSCHADPHSGLGSRQESRNDLESPDASSFRFHSGSSLLGTAMTGRLFPERNLILFVCMTELQDPEMLEDSGLVCKYIKSPLEALHFIEKYCDSLAAVVTSSCKQEFEVEGVSGLDVCQDVRKRRGGDDVKPPFAVLVTKSFTMHEFVKECDVFVNPATQADGTRIAVKEVLRRLVPPTVVWVVQSTALVTDDTKKSVSDLGFTLRLFDSTLGAYEFVATCPWNVAAVVTSPFYDLVHKRELTGIEFAARLRERQACRFVAPFLLLLHTPSDLLTSRCKDVFDELLEVTDALTPMLNILREKVKPRVDRAALPGAVIFGRACYISLSNTFPSKFTAKIADEEFEFPNVEQFFQAVKHYGTREHFHAIRTNPSVHGALQLSWSLMIHSRAWNALRDDIMRFALFQKFKNGEFRNALLATGTKEIIQTTPVHDMYWGDGNQDGGRGHGRNRLGELLMEMRERIRRSSHDELLFPYARLKVLNQAENQADTRKYHSNNVFQIDYKTVLGTGGFGKVFKATDTFTSQAVAVKVMQLRRGLAPADVRREFEVLARIDDPNVVKVLNAEFDEDEAKIFMEFMSGGSVDSLVKKFRMYEPAIRHHIKQILDGLDALHRQYNIVHCDIKPQNFLIDGNVTKLSDFGSSCVSTNMAVTAGTYLYMSPSRLSNNEGSKADDIWAVGCSVVRMAMGGHHQPWMREDESPNDPALDLPRLIYRATQPPYHPAIPSKLSPKCQAFAGRCFTPNPEYRPSAGELLNDPWFFDPVPGVEPLADYLCDSATRTGAEDREVFSRCISFADAKSADVFRT